MHLVKLVSWAAAAAGVGAIVTRASAPSTAGVEALVQRRLPHHSKSFEFAIVNATASTELVNDTFKVSSTHNGKLLIQGNTVSALLSG